MDVFLDHQCSGKQYRGDIHVFLLRKEGARGVLTKVQSVVPSALQDQPSKPGACAVFPPRPPGPPAGRQPWGWRCGRLCWELLMRGKRNGLPLRLHFFLPSLGVLQTLNLELLARRGNGITRRLQNNALNTDLDRTLAGERKLSVAR